MAMESGKREKVAYLAALVQRGELTCEELTCEETLAVSDETSSSSRSTVVSAGRKKAVHVVGGEDKPELSMEESSLYEAVESNDVEKAMILLQNGADGNSRGGARNLSVLIKACINGNLRMVDLLLANDASVNTFEAGITALLAAAGENHTEVVNSLLQYNAGVNQTGKFNNAAIHSAAKANNRAMIESLLRCGAEVDIVDLSFMTPLCYAAKYGSETCVGILLAHNANPQHKSLEGTPLDIAKSRNHHDIGKRIEDAIKSEYQQSCDQLASSQQEEESVVHPPRLRIRSCPLPSVRPRYSGTRSQRPNRVVQATSEVLQSVANSTTRGVEELAEREELMQELTEELEQLKQTRDEVVEKLDFAKKKINEQEIALNAAVKECDDVKNQKEALERTLKEERQKTTAAEEDQGRLQELLSLSEKSNYEIRKQLQEGKEALGIPSSDLQLTDKQLGKGSYGEVRIAYWKECPVAVKMLYEILTTSPHNIDLLMQEVSVAWRVHHPNVASVCGVTLELKNERTKTDKNKAWIIMELLQASMAGVISESRRDKLQALTVREKVDMTHDSLSGLNYLHSLPRVVYHGDIRPTNILVTTTMKAKLGDLGAARFSDASLTVGKVSPGYTAPERMDGRSSTKSKETDVYSMGVSVCELFTEVFPDRLDRPNQIQLIKNRKVRHLCMKMVSDDPTKRPSAAEALTAIGLLRELDNYKKCPPRRMVKGKLDGVKEVTFTDRMW